MPVAAVVFSDTDLIPERRPERTWTGLRQLAAARALDLEVLAVRRVGRRGRARPIPPELRSTVLALPPWPIDPVRAASLRVALLLLGRPRAARPRVLIGFGGLGADATARAARAVGATAVGWVGADLDPVPAGLTEVWSADDRTARELERRGLRAFRASLVPAAAEVEAAEEAGPSGRILLVGPAPPDPAPLVEGLERVGSGIEARVLDGGGWPEALERSPDVAVAFREAGAVLAPDPEGSEADLVEALLVGRPVLGPLDRSSPFLRPEVGRGFDPTRAESVADAVAEVVAGLERGRFPVARLRRAGARAAAEVRSAAWVDRLLELGGRA